MVAQDSFRKEFFNISVAFPYIFRPDLVDHIAGKVFVLNGCYSGFLFVSYNDVTPPFHCSLASEVAAPASTTDVVDAILQRFVADSGLLGGSSNDAISTVINAFNKKHDLTFARRLKEVLSITGGNVNYTRYVVSN